MTEDVNRKNSFNRVLASAYTRTLTFTTACFLLFNRQLKEIPNKNKHCDFLVKLLLTNSWVLTRARFRHVEDLKTKRTKHCKTLWEQSLNILTYLQRNGEFFEVDNFRLNPVNKRFWDFALQWWWPVMPRFCARSKSIEAVAGACMKEWPSCG